MIEIRRGSYRMKYAPIPMPNDHTRADGKQYEEVRLERGESLETVAARIGCKPSDLAKFEAGEGLIIDDNDELWQLPNGFVRHGPASLRKPEGK